MIPPGDDIDRIMQVMQAAFDPAFGEAWTRRQVEDALVLGRCHYSLIDAAGHIAPASAATGGFYLARGGFDEFELLLLAVDPQVRRQGLGRKLLEQLEARARNDGAQRIFLEMRRGNPAESLYLAFGFRPVGIRPNYYRNAAGSRIDAITFVFDLVK